MHFSLHTKVFSKFTSAEQKKLREHQNAERAGRFVQKNKLFFHNE